MIPPLRINGRQVLGQKPAPTLSLRAVILDALRTINARPPMTTDACCDECATADEFEESKHPRDDSGKFGSGSGGTAPTLHKSRVLKGDPMNRGFVTTVKVNPTPDEMSDILDKHEEEGKHGTIRVVSAPNGNIGVADGHTATHIDLMMLLADEFDPKLERPDNEVFEHDWILSVQPRGPHTYDLQGRQVKVTQYKEADGYATGKPVNPKPDKWPEGLRRAFGITTADESNFVESEHPRSPDGKFGSGGGSANSTSLSKPEVIDYTAYGRQPAHIAINPQPTKLEKMLKDSDGYLRFISANNGDIAVSSSGADIHDDIYSALRDDAHPMIEGINFKRIVPVEQRWILKTGPADETFTTGSGKVKSKYPYKLGSLNVNVQRESGGTGPDDWPAGLHLDKPSAKSFVSPNVAEHLNFPEAITGLKSNRQQILATASRDIDRALGLQSRDMPAVGAWSDGAENSIMSEIDGGTFDELKVAAAMKASIAEQKAALVFQDAADGNAMLYSFTAKGDLDQIHDDLLDDGVEFHTVIPTEGGATIYVVDTSGDAHESVAKAAKRHSAKVIASRGNAEFIGSDKDDRDDAIAAYDRIIGGSGIRGAEAIWQRVRDAYGQTLHLTGDYGVHGMHKGHHKASSPAKHARESANAETLHAISEHLKQRTPQSHAAVMRAQEAAHRAGVEDSDFEESKPPAKRTTDVMAKVARKPHLFIDLNINGRHQRVTV